MTSRKRFERFATRQGLSLKRMQEVTRNGVRWVYTSPVTEMSWLSWTAARRAFT